MHFLCLTAYSSYNFGTGGHKPVKSIGYIVHLRWPMPAVKLIHLLRKGLRIYTKLLKFARILQLVEQCFATIRSWNKQRCMQKTRSFCFWLVWTASSRSHIFWCLTYYFNTFTNMHTILITCRIPRSLFNYWSRRRLEFPKKFVFLKRNKDKWESYGLRFFPFKGSINDFEAKVDQCGKRLRSSSHSPTFHPLNFWYILSQR